MGASADAPAEVAPRGAGVLRSTALGIVAPRRLVPIVVILVPLLFIQWHFSRDDYALPLGAAMCLAFLAIAPAAWRFLFPVAPRTSAALAWPAPARLAVYFALGPCVVFGIGRLVPNLTGMHATFMTVGSSLLVSTALFWVGGWGLARDIDHEENLAAERARAAALERAAEHAQLLALESNLDPHFLFNTLNAIAEWCRSDGAVAEKALLQLSAMLRTVMDGIKVTEWPLAKDVELVDALFAMYLVRDPDMFVYAREVDDAAARARVPPMILLPLAENAMKHGPSAGHKGEVRLRVRADGERVVVTIENPGAYKGPRAAGSGLDIVKRRLALSHGGRATLDIRGAEGRTIATVTIPTAPHRGHGRGDA
jgi:hypothetical protein